MDGYINKICNSDESMTHSEDSLKWIASYKKKQYTDRAVGEKNSTNHGWESRDYDCGG